MTISEIGNNRLVNQCITDTNFTSPVETVRRMGAVQAQDYAMAKWAVGVRTKQATDKMVEDAFNRGEFLRTHLLRPTWHIAAAEDIYWMLALSAPRIKTALASRHKQLEINTDVVHKSHDIIVKYLTDNTQATRKELVAELEKAGFNLKDNRAAHLLMLAEMDELICSGPVRNREQTYALLENRVSHKKSMTREEALAELAKRYFTSRGPATLQDFIWWSNQTIKDARNALEMIKPSLHSLKTENETYWFPEAVTQAHHKSDAVYLLPAYDEFIICYKDRSAVLEPEYQKNVISSNGIFWPVIIINDQVKGKWKRTVQPNKVSIETELFKPLPNQIMKRIEQQAERFGGFLEKPNIIKHKRD